MSYNIVSIVTNCIHSVYRIFISRKVPTLLKLRFYHIIVSMAFILGVPTNLNYSFKLSLDV